MEMINLFFILFSALVGLSSTISTSSSLYYTAGVVEYQPLKTTNLTSDVNIKEYIRLIKSNEARDLDILVFPEATLYEVGVYIPDPNDAINPCDSNDDRFAMIKDISCAAKSTNTYIVINIAEISDCTPESQIKLNDTRPCARNGLNRYNTNVVFDRQGQVIARYRKFNLFREFNTNTTLVPDISVFTTDFGVTFGQFICFDLLFDRPAGDLIRLGITNIIYSTMWFSEMPYLTAVQTQQNWAYVNNVNFIASGASRPKRGTTGSGIYSGRLGSLVSVMKNDGEIRIYKARVPKIPANKIFDPTCDCDRQISPDLNDLPDLHLIQEHFEPFETKLLESKTQSIDERICHNNLCCDFTIVMTSSPLTEGYSFSSYKYRMGVFNGIRLFGGVVNSGVSVCGIMACTNDTIESCGVRFKDPNTIVDQITFKSILIKGKFDSRNHTLIMPNSLKRNMMPLEPVDFNFITGSDYQENDDTFKDVYYQLYSPQTKLLSFGIFSRVFHKDKWVTTDSQTIYEIKEKHYCVTLV